MPVRVAAGRGLVRELSSSAASSGSAPIWGRPFSFPAAARRSAASFLPVIPSLSVAVVGGSPEHHRGAI